MQTNKLVILAAAAVVAIGLGIWLASERTSQSESASTALYPELKKTVNEVNAVRIFTSGNTRAVEIARKDSTWVITEKNGFPADDAKVRKLLLNLANAKISEEKTSNPENYATLGVEDVTGDSSSVRIEVAGAAPAVDLIIGKQGPGMESQYVRRTGEAQSWLIDKDLDTSATPQDWLRKEVIDVSADRIQSARIETAGAKAYTVAKKSKADADFTVDGLPKGKKLSSPSAANTLATALASVTLSDVQPADSFKDVAVADKAVYQTFDGLVVELQGWSREDKHYLAYQTRFDASLAERFKTPSEATANEPADGEQATQTKPTATGTDVAEQAKTLNDRANGWVFEIADYKYDSIFKPATDLLAD